MVEISEGKLKEVDLLIASAPQSADHESANETQLHFKFF